MLRSGNDAALAIARGVSGSVEKFVEIMNKKAKELNMSNSIFNNPSGLDANEEGNLSTSYDLALLMSSAIQNDIFSQIIATKVYKSEIGAWKNKNKLLTSYKYNLGGKTGFTDKAKRTLVTASRQDETTLVVVTLDCGNDFNFHKFLYESNFNKYQSFKLLNKGENYIEDYIISCKKDIYINVEKENMSKYSVVYKINNNKATIYLVRQEKHNLVDTCNISKQKEGNKLTFWDKIKNLLRFG